MAGINNNQKATGTSSKKKTNTTGGLDGGISLKNQNGDTRLGTSGESNSSTVGLYGQAMEAGGLGLRRNLASTYVSQQQGKTTNTATYAENTGVQATVSEKNGTSNSTATYAENIGTGASASTENTGSNTTVTSSDSGTSTSTSNTDSTTSGIEATEGATDGNSGSTAENTTTEATTEKPLSYTEYLEMLKSDAEKSRQEADKKAEIAKERAMIDAQSSYAQNRATYGTNAELLAQMGLTGGGYSDYLDAQAYAQMRSDVQQANATYSSTTAQNEANYRDYVNSINQKLAEKALYEAEEEQNSASSVESSSKTLLQDALSNIMSGSANMDYIDALKILGMTDEDYETAKAYYNDYTQKQGISSIEQAIETSDLKSAEEMIDSAVANGTMDEDTKYKYYYDMAVKTVNNCMEKKDEDGNIKAPTKEDILECARIIEMSKNVGNLTDGDYANALKYLYENAGKSLPGETYSVSYHKNYHGGTLYVSLLNITFNGKTYEIDTRVNKELDEDTEKILTGINGGVAAIGSVVKYNGKVYVYRDFGNSKNYKNGWKELSSGADNKKFSAALDKYFETTPKATAASHTKAVKAASGTWKSYKDAADAGYSGIKTEREFARRGGSDKQKYGTYEKYLAAMYDKYVGGR